MTNQKKALQNETVLYAMSTHISSFTRPNDQTQTILGTCLPPQHTSRVLVIYLSLDKDTPLILTCTKHRLQQKMFILERLPRTQLWKERTFNKSATFWRCLRCTGSAWGVLEVPEVYWRCLWYNGYRRRKWTRRCGFKSWPRLIVFHIALIP